MMKMMFGWEGELFFSLLPEHADTTSNTVNVIAPESSEVLRYLADKKLLPGNLATVIEAEPLQGPLTLLVTRERTSDEIVLGLNLASLVIVDLK